MVVDFSLIRPKDEHFLFEFLAASRFVCNLKFSVARKAFSAALSSSVCSPFATLSGPLQALLRGDGSHRISSRTSSMFFARGMDERFLAASVL